MGKQMCPLESMVTDIGIVRVFFHQSQGNKLLLGRKANEKRIF